MPSNLEKIELELSLQKDYNELTLKPSTGSIIFVDESVADQDIDKQASALPLRKIEFRLGSDEE